MRAYVLGDARLARQAGRFVWLEVNAERDVNAAFLEAFPVEAYPTLLVVDPSGEQAVVKWAGAASAPQVAKLLDEGRAAIAGATGADAHLARAERALAGRRFEEAAAAYRQALSGGGRAWARRGRAAEALVNLLWSRDDEACAREARALAPTLPQGPSRASVAASGLSCALALPEAVPWRAAARQQLEKATRAALRWPDLSADLRSGLHEALVEARRAAGDEAGARAAARAWWEFLVAERARAPGARARSSFDAATVSAALALGEAARALPLIERSERDLPGDYDPPYWVAVAAREAGRLDQALAAADRALALGYGARKLRLFAAKASVLEKQGDRAGQRAALEAALAHARALPAPQLRQRERALVEKLRAQLQGLDGSE